MREFTVNIAQWILRRRWWVIAVTIVFTLAAAGGVGRLTINNDTRVFFSKKNPQLQALEALENTYTRDKNIFFVIAPQDGTVFTPGTLKAIAELTDASWEMPYSSRVDSITNFQHTRVDEDELIVEDLVDATRTLSACELDRIQGNALAEPLLVKRLISPSGHVTGVNVSVQLPGASLQEVPEVVSFAHRLAQETRGKYPDIDIYLTGQVMMDYTFGQASERDLSILIPAMILVLTVLVGLSLRSLYGTFTTLAITLMSMLTGLGLAGWLGMSLNAASVGAPVLIMTLAVADSVHILATMFQLMRQGQPKHPAIAQAVRINLSAVFLTSMTTAIGFLSMNFSDAPPFRDLGNVVAVGVMAAFFQSALFLPALLAVLPIRVKPRPRNTGPIIWDRMSDFVIRRRKLVFWGMLVGTAVLTAGIAHIELNDNFLKCFDESFAFRRATDYLTENLAGWDLIEYSLESGEPGGIHDPAYLAVLDQFADWYRRQPQVIHVDSLTETVKRLNQKMHGDDPAYRRIPEQRELAAQYLMLYEMSLPFGLDLNNQINIDKSSTRLIVTFASMSANEILAMDNAARQWLQAQAPEHMRAQGTGLSMVWAHVTTRNIRSMLWASFLAVAIISVILMLALRSFKLGLISLIPNLAPALMAFGLWGMVVGQVGLGLSVVMGMTIGIVVDDTVHFLSKYLRARRGHGMDPGEAIQYAFNTVGRAMWVTTVALVLGFLVLTLSHYRMCFDMGLMSAITIALALLMDFLLLPTLLMAVDQRSHKTVETHLLKENQNHETLKHNHVSHPDVVDVALDRPCPVT